MPEPTLEEYQLHVMVLREWKLKTNYRDAARNVNKYMGKMVISMIRIEKLYKLFNNGHFGFDMKNVVFPSYSFSSQSSSSQCKEVKKTNKNEKKTNKNLFDSILLADTGKYLNGHVHTNDGRFLWYFHTCQEQKQNFITIHDLFRDMKRTTPISFSLNSPSSYLVGDYLFLLEQGYYKFNNYCTLYTFQINYDDLSVKEKEWDDINFGLYESCYIQIFEDQLEKRRFVMFDQYSEHKMIVGRFQQKEDNTDELILEEDQVFSEDNLNGIRFFGNKLQGFKYQRYNIMRSVKFWEFNLDTMEKTEIDVPIKFDGGSKLDAINSLSNKWTKTYFYNMLRLENRQFKLLFFDPKTLKWSDIQIWTVGIKAMFVDENDVITFRFGCRKSQCVSYYRQSLRKPDTLMNLTRLTTVKESNIHKNGKCLKIANQMFF